MARLVTFNTMSIVVYIINLLIMAAVFWFESGSGNDKTGVITGFVAVILIVLNLMLGLFSAMDKKPISRSFFISAFGVLILSMFALTSA